MSESLITRLMKGYPDEFDARVGAQAFLDEEPAPQFEQFAPHARVPDRKVVLCEPAAATAATARSAPQAKSQQRATGLKLRAHLAIVIGADGADSAPAQAKEEHQHVDSSLSRE